MHGRSKHAPKHMSLANESKPDRKAVIVLTCCALQSACYSPTGIVILFILAQFQGKVQTNLTAGQSFLLFRVCLRGFGGGCGIGRFHLSQLLGSGLCLGLGGVDLFSLCLVVVVGAGQHHHLVVFA